MFLGRVAGTVWSTVKWPQAQGLKLLLVRPYRLGDLPPGAARRSPGASGARSRPTIWWSARTRSTPGRATTSSSRSGTRRASRSARSCRRAASRWSRSTRRWSRSSIAWRSRGEGRRPAPPRRRGDARGRGAGGARRRQAAAARRQRVVGGAARAVVTTTGKNQRGIVAKIAQAIADAGGDIVDISQTLVSDYFTMIIIVDTGRAVGVVRRVQDPARAYGGRRLGAECLVMHEDVVNALQRV